MKKNLLLKLGTTTVFTLPVITFDSCSDSNNKQTVITDGIHKIIGQEKKF